MIELWPTMEGTQLIDAEAVYKLAESRIFNGVADTDIAGVGRLGYIFQLTGNGLKIAMHVSRSTVPGKLALKLRLLPRRFGDKTPLPLRATVERALKAEKLIKLYKSAVEKFSKHRVATARVAAESKIIESIVKELPRDLKFGGLTFKRYSAGRDPSEAREYAQYECTLSAEFDWAVRIYVYLYATDSTSPIADHNWPLSYYIGFGGGPARFSDVFDHVMKPSSVATLLEDIKKSLQGLVKTGKEKLVTERIITDKKLADEFMRRYKEVLK
jgi:hypothetical protein